MDGRDFPTLRVRALQPKRRRGGLDFTSEPRDLTADMLGSGLLALMVVAAILSDPLLAVTIVQDEAERPVSEEEIAELTAILEAEKMRVDPDDPPTAEAAAMDAGDPPAADPPAADPPATEAAAPAKRKR